MEREMRCGDGWWFSVAMLVLGAVATGCGGGDAADPTGGPAGVGGGAADFIAPVAGAVSCDVLGGGGFGFYPSGRPLGLEDHYGIDLEASLGTEVRASRDGYVIRADAEQHPSLGYLVILDHGEHAGRRIYTLYAHLQAYDPTLEANSYVVQGQRLGWTGDTGVVTGPHLHFALVRSVSSLPFHQRGPYTGVAPSYDEWADPALYVTGLQHCIGPGPAPALPSPAAPPAPSPGENPGDDEFEPVYMLDNGGFEDGGDDWDLSGDFWADAGDPDATHSRRGEGYAAGGVSSSGYAKNMADGTMEQSFKVPSGASQVVVRVYVNVTSKESSAATSSYDKLVIQILGGSGRLLGTVCSLSNRDQVSSKTNYTRYEKTISGVGGEALTLRCAATSDLSLETVFRIDDASVLAK